MSVSRHLDSISDELSRILDPSEKQIYLLRCLEEMLEADFSSFNIVDSMYRVIGGIAWPLTQEKSDLVQEFAPKLNAIIPNSIVADELMRARVGSACVMPESQFRESVVYREVYQAFDMHFLAFYAYPAMADGNLVLVSVSSERGSFDSSKIRIFERFCQRFEKSISGSNNTGIQYSIATRLPDHRLTLDSAFVAKQISPYLLSAIQYFYNDPVTWLGEDRFRLPQNLVSEIQCQLEKLRNYVQPFGEDIFFSFNKRRNGRQLNVVFETLSTGGDYQISCYEDLSAFERLRRVRRLCDSLKRDRHSIFAACLALLDDISDIDDVLQTARLSALKPSSARRIISRARSVVEEC